MGKLSGIFRKQEQKGLKKETWLPGELYRNRRLVLSLAKNDFKTKYAGSYFGTVWAFIQPVVTICVYWFVFGLALRGGAHLLAPFPAQFFEPAVAFRQPVAAKPREKM